MTKFRCLVAQICLAGPRPFFLLSLFSFHFVTILRNVVAFYGSGPDWSGWPPVVFPSVAIIIPNRFSNLKGKMVCGASQIWKPMKKTYLSVGSSTITKTNPYFSLDAGGAYAICCVFFRNIRIARCDLMNTCWG